MDGWLSVAGVAGGTIEILFFLYFAVVYAGFVRRGRTEVENRGATFPTGCRVLDVINIVIFIDILCRWGASRFGPPYRHLSQRHMIFWFILTS